MSWYSLADKLNRYSILLRSPGFAKSPEWSEEEHHHKMSTQSRSKPIFIGWANLFDQLWLLLKKKKQLILMLVIATLATDSIHQKNVKIHGPLFRPQATTYTKLRFFRDTVPLTISIRKGNPLWWRWNWCADQAATFFSHIPFRYVGLPVLFLNLPLLNLSLKSQSTSNVITMI